MLTRRQAIFVMSSAAACLPGLAGASAPLNIVATTGMIADAARVLGGPSVTVEALMGPGVDPHGYRQTRTDIVSLTRADLIFWHGLGLEAQMEQVLADLARRSPVKAVADTLPVTELLAHDVYEGRYDPHVWMDPKLWSLVVSEMREAMAKTRPELAAEFTANAESYQTQLTRLDEYAQRVLGSVPEERRVLVTAHDAFGYFGRAYGYEVMGLQGISTEAEAGLNRISELVDTIVSRKIAAVFVESSVSDRAMRALIEGAAAQGHTLRIGGELFSDAMGPEGSYEGSYLGMLDHNITTIAKALGGVVPGRGMDGKLTKAV